MTAQLNGRTHNDTCDWHNIVIPSHMFSESRIPHAQFSSGVTLARKQKADGQRWPSTIQTDHRRPVPRLTVLVCRSCGRLYQASPQPCKSRMSSPCQCDTFHPSTVGTRTSAAIACILCRLSAAMPPQHSVCGWQRRPPEDRIPNFGEQVPEEARQCQPEVSGPPIGACGGAFLVVGLRP